MRKRDGTGPIEGRGGGRMGGDKRGGPTGSCVCPSCGTKASHGRGIPCYETACPKCGTKMVRE